jgi:DNA-binding transcriptional LysR family regulator
MMKRSELALLRAMYQYPTVTAAAESVSMSQPAASALLRALETRLGFDLFTRENRRLQLTSHGRALLPEVLNALAGLDSVDRLARDIRHGSTTRLAIGAVAIVASSIMPAALHRLQAMHPAIAITVRAGTALEITDMAVDQRVDIGIIIGTPSEERVGVRLLSRLGLYCVMRADHPLAGNADITLADVTAHRFVVLGTALPAGRATARELAAAGIARTPAVEVMQSSAAVALAAAGAGIAIVESLGALYAQRQALVTRRLMAVEDLALHLVWPRGKGMSKVAQDLAVFLAADVARLAGLA